MFGRISIVDPVSGHKNGDKQSLNASDREDRLYLPISSKRVTIGNTLDDNIRICGRKSLNQEFQIEIFVTNNENTLHSNDFFIRSLKGTPFQLNGDTVRGARRVELKNNDRLTIGENTLLFNKCLPPNQLKSQSCLSETDACLPQSPTKSLSPLKEQSFVAEEEKCLPPSPTKSLPPLKEQSFVAEEEECVSRPFSSPKQEISVTESEESKPGTNKRFKGVVKEETIKSPLRSDLPSIQPSSPPKQEAVLEAVEMSFAITPGKHNFTVPEWDESISQSPQKPLSRLSTKTKVMSPPKQETSVYEADESKRGTNKRSKRVVKAEVNKRKLRSSILPTQALSPPKQELYVPEAEESKPGTNKRSKRVVKEKTIHPSLLSDPPIQSSSPPKQELSVPEVEESKQRTNKRSKRVAKEKTIQASPSDPPIQPSSPPKQKLSVPEAEESKRGTNKRSKRVVKEKANKPKLQSDPPLSKVKSQPKKELSVPKEDKLKRVTNKRSKRVVKEETIAKRSLRSGKVVTFAL